MAANGIVREALGDLDARLDHWKQTLVDLCRIPSISAASFPPEEVRRSAQCSSSASPSGCATPSTATNLAAVATAGARGVRRGRRGALL